MADDRGDAVSLLRSEWAQWSEFDVLPGQESIDLWLDELASFQVNGSPSDLAFLFATLGLLRVADESDDAHDELDEAIGIVGDILFDAANDREPFAPFLAPTAMQLISVSVLGDSGPMLNVARARSGIEAERTLYCLLSRPRGRSVEVVVGGPEINASAFNGPREAEARIRAWFRQMTG